MRNTMSASEVHSPLPRNVSIDNEKASKFKMIEVFPEPELEVSQH